MGLLCLVSSEKLYSQHCFDVFYDKNGNRINFKEEECLKYYRNNTDDKIYDSDEDNSDLMVYPNPNNGRFRIELKDVDKNEMSETEMYIYDNKGVLVYNRRFVEEVDVDISINPSGVYLLRVVGGNNDRNVVVVKF